MASEVELCNIALSRLGDVANVTSIDPPDGSIQAEYCKTFYPIARDTAQAKHHWSFCTRRMNPPLVTFPFNQWAYAYAAPAGMIDVISIMDTNAGSDFGIAEGATAPQPFSVESLDDGTQVILTDQPDALLRYTVRVTDTSKFTALFNDAVTWLIASYVAGPLLKGDVGATAAQSCFKSFDIMLRNAIARDSQNQRRDVKHTPGWIKGR